MTVIDPSIDRSNSPAPPETARPPRAPMASSCRSSLGRRPNLRFVDAQYLSSGPPEALGRLAFTTQVLAKLGRVQVEQPCQFGLRHGWPATTKRGSKRVLDFVLHTCRVVYARTQSQPVSVLSLTDPPSAGYAPQTACSLANASAAAIHTSIEHGRASFMRSPHTSQATLRSVCRTRM